jgi:hypothetical protein
MFCLYVESRPKMMVMIIMMMVIIIIIIIKKGLSWGDQWEVGRQRHEENQSMLHRYVYIYIYVYIYMKIA